MDGPAFSLLRDLPSRPTQRVCKLSTDLDAAAAEQDTRSFAGAKPEQQLMLRAFQSTWQELLTTMRDLQQHTMAGVLQQLQQWSAQTAGQPGTAVVTDAMPDSALQQSPVACDDGLLPTAALSLASSTNTAEAYAHLLYTLKQQGHPTALVSARETGTSIAAVVNSALRQFLGMPTPADDMPALLAWWKDELQRSKLAGPAAASPPCTALPAAETPCTGEATAQHGAETTPAAAKPQRQLRSRATAGTPGGKTPAAAGRGTAGAAQLQVPVLVLQDSDTVDADAFEELVVALHEARQAGLPLVLVLGITMSHHGLLQLLPNRVMRSIRLLQLSLPPARQQLAHLYRAVLLGGPQPKVVLGPACAAWLLEHFRDVDASASTAQRAMQLACVEHYLQQPMSCLAAAAASGSRKRLQAAIRALPAAQLQHCCTALQAAANRPSLSNGASGLSSDSSTAAVAAAQEAAVAHLATAAVTGVARRGGKQGTGAAADAAAVLEGAVWGAMTAFQQWRVGLLLLSLVANFTGAAEVDASYQLPALYTAAQQPAFLTVSKHGLLSTCGRLLLKLLGAAGSGGAGSSWPQRAGVVAVDQLRPAECAELLQKLLLLLKGAQQGRAAARSNKAANDSSRSAGGDDHNSSSSSSDDYDDSGSESDEGSDGAADVDRRHARQSAKRTALADSRQVQQLLQALETLQAATAASAVDDHQQQQQQQSHGKREGTNPDLGASLSSFCSTFADALTPLPEQRQLQQQPDASAAALPAITSDLDEDMDDDSAATAAALGVYSTPAAAKASRGGGGSGSVHTPLPTPGGLASQLRRRVRFAPDTPDHARAKAAGAGGSSAKSTPDGEAAPGLIKTPNKKSSSSGKKPRKKLFDSKAAAAAAAAAAGSSAGKPRRSSKREKQQSEVGDIAGSSAAALAAVTAAAGGVAVAGSTLGNKRHARLRNIMANALPDSPGAAAGAGGGSAAGRSPLVPATSSKRQQQQEQQAGLLLSPIMGSNGDSAAAAVTSSPDVATASPPPAAAAAAAGASRGRARGVTGGRACSGSRLSRRSGGAAAAEGDANDDDNDDDVMAHMDEVVEGSCAADMGDAIMQQDSDLMLQPPAAAAAAAATAAAGVPAVRPQSCSGVLAQLLNAAIPKLLLDWSHPSSKDSRLYEQLSSSILNQQQQQQHEEEDDGDDPAGGCGTSTSTSISKSSSKAGREAVVAAGTSLAAAGAAAFVFDDVQLLEQHLAPAAPAGIHTALVAPGLKLPGHPVEVVGKTGWEDTCLAYVLLQQQRDDGLPVSDWFGLFCEALGLKGFQQGALGAAAGGAGDGDGGDGDGDGADMMDADGGPGATSSIGAAAGGVVGPAAGRALRSKARAGRKARGFADARAAAAAAGAEEPPAAGAAAGDGGQTPSRQRSRSQQDQDSRPAGAAAAKGGRKRGGSAAAATGGRSDAGGAGDYDEEQVDQQELLAAAARFSQAAAELQLLGVWKGTKRRRAAGVLRVFAPEGPALPSMAAAAAAAAAADMADV